MTTFLIGLAIGVAVGWVAFERPELVRELIAKVKARFAK